VFEDWKSAWRQAVENFRRELSESDDGTPAHTRAMRREVASARGALDRLLEEIERTRGDAVSERDHETICRRRENLARNIGDEETVRLAAQFAARHQERAEVIERKVEILVAEHALLARDLASMEEILVSQPVSSVGEPSVRDVIEPRDKQDRDFARLDRDARERAAAARLEELKRRMQ
jgi:hypothetical protein